MKATARLIGALMLTGAFAATAMAQMVTPLIPSDALARPRTPQQQAVLDASTRELMRVMAELKINELRPPKNAVNPAGTNFTNYNERFANPYPALPDLLAFKNGRSVKTRADWIRRRAEIKALFDSEVYGKYPANIPKVTWKVDTTENLVHEGIPVVVKRITGSVDNSSYPAITVPISMTVVTPASAKGRRVPVIIGGGNIPPAPAPGAAPPPPVAGRGAPNPRLSGPPTDSPAKQLLAKGWGFVSVNANQIQPDNAAGLTQGIIGLVNKGRPRKLDDWGVLRAWAWAQSRAMDYLMTDRDVDNRKVGVFGHSRGGKGALIALVDDPRFAIGFISSSGAGGANLYRRNYGELSENLCAPNEFHWMAGNFLKYCAVGRTIDELPVDSHQFIALVAPRSIFIGGGDLIMEPGMIPGDAWQDAKGMFMAAAAASPAWEFYGKKGLGTSTLPRIETALTSGSVGFRQHLYGHVPGPNWSHFIAFAEKEFASRK